MKIIILTNLIWHDRDGEGCPAKNEFCLWKRGRRGGGGYIVLKYVVREGLGAVNMLYTRQLYLASVYTQSPATHSHFVDALINKNLEASIKKKYDLYWLKHNHFANTMFFYRSLSLHCLKAEIIRGYIKQTKKARLYRTINTSFHYTIVPNKDKNILYLYSE